MSTREDPSAPTIRLGPVSSIALPDQPSVEPTEATHIRGLIARLAEIDQPDFGLSQTLSGHSFAPIAGSEQIGMALWANHSIQPSSTLGDLVERGPRALPFLLEALDDQTPTGLRVGGMMGQWFGHEMGGNPANPVEAPLLPQPGRRPGSFGPSFEDLYTLKVGDVCFVAVGQIVGRRYLAVRYQPSMCVVVNSPTHDDWLCQQVRAIWFSDHPARHLFDSLLFDFATEAIDAADGSATHRAATFRESSAMRLLYYFPRESSSLIASYLHRLGTAVGERFLKAVAWSVEPAVRAELSRIFLVSDDPGICVAALPALIPDGAGSARSKLERLLESLPATEPGPHGQGWHLLIALGGHGGEEVKPAFRRYLDGGDVNRCLTLSLVLRMVKLEWDVELLSPLLGDRRPFSIWFYSPDPKNHDHRMPLRVCDVAAETLALNHAGLNFLLAGNYEDLDRQIQSIQERIATGVN